MTNNIKAKAREFRIEFGIQSITLNSLRDIISRQGYQIVEYNNIFNDENVSALIDSLGVEWNCEHSRGFTYADTKRRLVFLHEDLSESEKLMVLAHEEGHIYCNHFASVPIIGRDVIEEHEANEFAHYLLNPGTIGRVSASFKQHRKKYITCLIALVLILFATITIGMIQREKQYYGDFYVTTTGNKYHEEKCIFVKNKNNARRMTVEEFESGYYEPCEICLPHGETPTEKVKE